MRTLMYILVASSSFAVLLVLQMLKNRHGLLTVAGELQPPRSLLSSLWFMFLAGLCTSLYFDWTMRKKKRTKT
ncbi:hypothetical protein SY83_03225 [Paenibacillus swuensis]|uniref:Uncharacterized protein n=1 Tax=Paenibacillus swuensis TaxID=1178515 RepID=A0A172TFD1_9BACL|nr:hypothetical protein [Paenibacillus swuensis]ANE45493.1 hypothetical protein SY83_03225 [Paenibacillus swuensis]